MLRVLALFVIAWFSHADLGFISNDDGVSGRADDLLIEVVAPAPAAEIFESEVRLFAKLGGSVPPTAKVCWRLTSVFLTEDANGCWPISEVGGWNGTRVYLPNRGTYRATASIMVPNAEESGIDVLLSTSAASTFFYVVSQSCQLALKNRPGVQPSYYSGIVNGGVRSGERAERSLDSEADQWVNFEYSPRCYDTWNTHVIRSDFFEKTLLVTSSSRGAFGVDYSMQQLGHGDRIFLDFVLAKHHGHTPSSHITEFGTFGGVTALYLGMAAALRGGDLDSFDIQDDRSAEVQRVWLPNMHFHLGNANSHLPRTDDSASSDSTPAVASTGDAAVAAIRRSGFVLVDHADRLAFATSVAGPNLPRGAVLMVHDFPPEYTTVKMWDEALAPLGIFRRYDNVQTAGEVGIESLPEKRATGLYAYRTKG